MVLKQKLNSVIQLSHDELALLKEHDINLTLLNKLETDRFQQIKLLFESFHMDELAVESDLLNQIKILDEQLTTGILERKKLMTKELSDFRKNTKALKAYKNI
jgi:hypothetical protein